MSLTYGVYLSAIGASVVFAALLIIVLTCMVVKRIFKAEEPEKKDLREVAALAAICQFLEYGAPSLERKAPLERRSNWTAVARLEALGVGVDRDR